MAYYLHMRAAEKMPYYLYMRAAGGKDQTR